MNQSLTVITSSLLITSIIIGTTSFQPIIAPEQGGCDACGSFLRIATQFERYAGIVIRHLAAENHSNSYPEFRQLLEHPRIISIVASYAEQINQKFLDKSGTIP